jgi:hypothetical protein
MALAGRTLGVVSVRLTKLRPVTGSAYTCRSSIAWLDAVRVGSIAGAASLTINASVTSPTLSSKLIVVACPTASATDGSCASAKPCLSTLIS